MTLYTMGFVAGIALTRDFRQVDDGWAPAIGGMFAGLAILAEKKVTNGVINIINLLFRSDDPS